VQYAGRRGLAADGWRWLPRDAATEGWALESRGYACHEAPGAEGSARRASARPPLARRASPAIGAAQGVSCSLS
jgi:hypothetical protein